MFKVEYFPEAKEDILKLPIDILLEVKEYLKKYETNPYMYSQQLYDRFGLDLSRCRKTYLANATYRIVIMVENSTTKVVEVVAVGQRESKEVYQNAHKRVNFK